MPTAVSSIGFYSMARGNLLGARHIFRALPTQEQNINPCIQFLLGFAIEGYLKAFLAQNKFTLKQLLGIGHNLKAAMQAVEDHGIVLPERSKLCFVVDHMAVGHLKLQYRYLDGSPTGSMTLVYPRTAFEALVPLDKAVFEVLQADINEEEMQLGLSITTTWHDVPPL